MKNAIQTKYSPLLTQLMGVGGIFGVLSWFIEGTAKELLEELGSLALAAAFLVFLIDVVKERRQSEAKKQAEAA